MSNHFFTQSTILEKTQSALQLNNEARECYDKARDGILALEEQLGLVQKKRESLISTSPGHPRIKRYEALIEETNKTLSSQRDRLRQLEVTIGQVDTLILVSKL
ncbi:hypothetical protein [Legionella sp. CNM-4043-24]|uniref:hypothetical protein n=1 Tax=Legionella sp. CNM-4043-24 TaxID=3421646 RepID=UPI00403ABBAE